MHGPSVIAGVYILASQKIPPLLEYSLFLWIFLRSFKLPKGILKSSFKFFPVFQFEQKISEKLTRNLQVGQVCWRRNQPRRHERWKIWPHGSFLHADATMVSLQMIQTLSLFSRSSSVAKGKLVFRSWMARRDNTTSFKA